ncbi:hypothetical protein [Desertivirga arenae]|uniref:hypothetical protein n=1 Tax=Desertivirga arenae TaxID=2810309 RepID=UPI001A95EDA8|nr:hypothetical protein [Pedobacter sp. SYSU D00823]
MKTRNTLFSILTAATFITSSSCKKESSPQIITDPIYTVDLVKTIRWANSGTETYSYNADSTLKKTIAGSTGATTMTRDFNYTNKKLTQVIKSNLMEENYEYNSHGRISSIVEKLVGTSYPGTKLEFDYNTDGTLKTMKYYEFDDLRSNLKSTSTYEYDNQKRPYKITTIGQSNPGTKVIFDLENYSGNFYINPFSLLEPWHLVAEDYQVYNFALLSSLNRLPGKVTRKIEVNGTVQETESETFTYEVKNNRLESILHHSNNFKISLEY